VFEQGGLAMPEAWTQLAWTQLAQPGHDPRRQAGSRQCSGSPVTTMLGD
jgi:hypothetical protein